MSKKKEFDFTAEDEDALLHAMLAEILGTIQSINGALDGLIVQAESNDRLLKSIMRTRAVICPEVVVENKNSFGRVE